MHFTTSTEILPPSTKGSSVLSDEEILQYFMPKTAATQLLSEYGSIYNVIMDVSAQEFMKLKGIGGGRLRKIQSLRALIRRLQAEKAPEIKFINSPQDSAHYMADLQELKHEQFHTILLNTKNGIIGQQIITRGTIQATIVTAREIFYPAIKHMACNIILVHNHPSGNSAPSQEDIEVTGAMLQASKILGIDILDHIIIGRKEYYSFAESGMLKTLNKGEK